TCRTFRACRLAPRPPGEAHRGEADEASDDELAFARRGGPAVDDAPPRVELLVARRLAQRRALRCRRDVTPPPAPVARGLDPALQERVRLGPAGGAFLLVVDLFTVQAQPGVVQPHSDPRTIILVQLYLSDPSGAARLAILLAIVGFGAATPMAQS